MKQSQFLEKKEKWLSEVSDECHEFAKKIDLDFYVFQTPCDEYNPKLLLIGINPHGHKSYQEALKGLEELEGKKYDKKPAKNLYYKENTIDKKPKWEIEKNLKGSDVMRNNLHRVFHNLDILKDTVMMNMFYFNVDKSEDIYKFDAKIRKYCFNKTVEFIDIINPQNVLFLTSDPKFLRSFGVKNITGKENFIKQGILGERTVYAIPNYGYYSAYSYENSAKMGKLLSEIFK